MRAIHRDTAAPTPPRNAQRPRARDCNWRALSRAALLALVLPLNHGALAQGRVVSATDMEELMRRGGCMLCHRWSRPWIGPSFREIAQQHRGATVQERQVLADRLRRGSVGNHSPIPMGPCDVSRLNDEELRLVIDHLLENGLRKDLAKQ